MQITKLDQSDLAITVFCTDRNVIFQLKMYNIAFLDIFLL